MELIQNVQNFTDAVYSLRYIIAAPFVVIGALMAWGWWNKVTM